MAEVEILPENITLSRFNELLSRYPSLIETISLEKASKATQPSLLDLDEYRYDAAVDAFRSDKPKQQMNHADVKKLVEWKLRHGKFRPTLMKLVSSNDEDVVKNTIQEAMGRYWSDKNSTAAMDTIAKLKGIGPATASLLLSVHDPEQVIFFSDEAFWWLCCRGQKSPIKYNAKEYQQLNMAARNIAKRLQVGATDIERVAYVVMKDETNHPAPVTSRPQNKSSAKKGRPANETTRSAPPKRKRDSVVDSDSRPLRRSKRQKLL